VEKTDSQSTTKNGIIPPLNETFYRVNLDALGPQAMKTLMEHPETPVPIDPNITVSGLKNPIYLVIVGFTTTKVLETARKSGKTIKNILIIEPDYGRFHQTIRRDQITHLVNDPTIDFIVGIPPEKLYPHIYQIFLKSDPGGNPRTTRCQTPEIVTDPFAYPSVNGDIPKEAQEVTQAVIETARQVFLSFGCASDSHTRWEQLWRNRENLQKCYKISPLFDKFKDIPAVVVGAGPSLQEFIDAYRNFNLKDKCLIIACDASLRKLLDNGIRPHIVTRCERKLTTIFRDVERSDTRDIFYAAYPWCSPEYFDLFESSFMLFRGNGVCRWSGYEPGEVNGGVSSANAALELAYLFGCKKIILTGVDLCFLDGRSHSDGTEVEFDPEKSRAKWKEIRGNSGPVTSIPVWMRCLKEYEGAVFKRPDIEVFNTSLKGAKIEGTKTETWEVLKDSVLSGGHYPLQTIKKHLEVHGPEYKERFEAKAKVTVQWLTQIKRDLDKLFLMVEDVVVTAKREEEKAVNQLRALNDPPEFFMNVDGVRQGLIKVFEEPARQIDQFKSKNYVHELFTQIILDICQADYFSTENKYFGLPNFTKYEHDRLRRYTGIQIDLFRTYHYYIGLLLKMMENKEDPMDSATSVIAEVAK